MTNLVPFPVSREVRFIRDTAFQIDRRSGGLAAKYWRTECNRLYARLQVQGFEDAVIRRQIDGFVMAVRAELGRLTGSCRQDHGGDAA